MRPPRGSRRRRARHQQAAIVGAEIERRIGRAAAGHCPMRRRTVQATADPIGAGAAATDRRQGRGPGCPRPRRSYAEAFLPPRARLAGSALRCSYDREKCISAAGSTQPSPAKAILVEKRASCSIWNLQPHPRLGTGMDDQEPRKQRFRSPNSRSGSRCCAAKTPSWCAAKAVTPTTSIAPGNSMP